MNLGRAVRELRYQKKITRKDIFKKTGIHSHTIQGIEVGRQNTRISTIELLADAIGVKVSDIFLEAEKYD